jgi:hypothetical protein
VVFVKIKFSKKILTVLVVFLCILEIFFAYSAVKSYSNKEGETKVVENDKPIYTTYIQNSSGQYIKYRTTDASIYPSGYTFNASKSYCEDLYGNKLDGVLTNSGTSFTLESGSTTICYLYFDL